MEEFGEMFIPLRGKGVAVPLVSLCSTNFNTYPIVGRSLESVVRQTEGLDREIVVVDNLSNDGSYEVLASCSGSIPIRLTRRRCSRGMGRQLAFKMARGEYIVPFDTDIVYNEIWGQLLRWVVAHHVDFELDAYFGQFFPRSALEQVGGWRDLQCCEDTDLVIRLAAKGLYRDYPVVCGENLKRHYATHILSKWHRYYRNHRDQIAIRCWIPLSLYLRGYAMQVRENPRFFFYLSVFLPAFLAALRKRRMLGDVFHDLSQCMDPSVRIDCGIVPPGALHFDWRYCTTSMCQEALARRDLGFLSTDYE